MEDITIIEEPIKGYLDPLARKKTALFSVIFYILAMYVLNLVIQIFLISISPIVTGVELYYLNDLGEKIITPENEEFINSWTQVLIYTIMVIGLVIINYKNYQEDFTDFKNNLKKRLVEIPIGLGIFYAVSFISSLLLIILNITDSSANQNALEQIVFGKYGSLVLLSIFLFGPISEELIFRQSAFRLFRKGTNHWTKIILTGVIFGSIHVTSAILMYLMEGSFSAIPKEFILGIPYILQGIALSYIYYRSNQNIIPVTIVHIINNLIAGIALLLPAL